MSKILVGKSLLSGHNLSPLIGIGLTNLPIYDGEQSSLVPIPSGGPAVCRLGTVIPVCRLLWYVE